MNRGEGGRATVDSDTDVDGTTPAGGPMDSDPPRGGVVGVLGRGNGGAHMPTPSRKAREVLRAITRSGSNRRFGRLLRQHLHLREAVRLLIVLVPLQVGQAAADLALPVFNERMIDRGVLGGDHALMLRMAVAMATGALFQVCLAVGATYLAAKAATEIGGRLRIAIIEHIQRFSNREVTHFGIATLLVRSINDVQQIQTMAMALLTSLIAVPIVCAGALALSFSQDVTLSLLLCFLVPVLGLLAGGILVRMQSAARAMQQRTDAVGRIMREQIWGVRVVRAFRREGHERNRFDAANHQLAAAALRINQLSTLLLPLSVMVVNLATIPLVLIGAHRIDGGQPKIGVLIAVLSYMAYILTALTSAIFVFVALPRAVVSAGRIVEVLDTKPMVAPPVAPIRHLHSRGTIEFRDVEVRYPGAEAPVLSGIDFIASPGQVTAIVGPTGSGKTTLLSLIPRLMDVTRGSVRVGGVDVRELDPAVLSAAVGVVPQRSYLFEGTIASNLRYGRSDATDEELWHALDVAQASGFVAAMPHGLEEDVAQAGANFSGGQRQRLAIARTLVRRPGIYLFDDAFAALDQATDANLRSALARETTEATVLIVAQRVSTIRHADQILVLDRGRLVGIGRHQDLMGNNQTYRQIVSSQFSEAV